MFTPLHGTGNIPVRDGLKALKYQHVTVVKEQELPDPEFSTVKSPNPEEHAAFRNGHSRRGIKSTLIY